MEKKWWIFREEGDDYIPVRPATPEEIMNAISAWEDWEHGEGLIGLDENGAELVCAIRVGDGPDFDVSIEIASSGEDEGWRRK
jgi:hypothetical protein